MKKLLLPVLLASLLAVPVPVAQAAPKCTRDGAVLVARGGDVIVVGIRRKPRGQETRRDDYYACLASTGRRFRILTSRDLGDDLIERAQFTFLAGRFLGVVRSFQGGVSASQSADTFDVVKRKRVHSTRKCDGVGSGDASGAQEIAFLPRGGLAYTCNRLWIADAKGERQLEADGTDVRQVAVSDGPFAEKLYWTVFAGETETVKSLTLTP